VLPCMFESEQRLFEWFACGPELGRERFNRSAQSIESCELCERIGKRLGDVGRGNGRDERFCRHEVSPVVMPVGRADAATGKQHQPDHEASGLQPTRHPTPIVYKRLVFDWKGNRPSFLCKRTNNMGGSADGPCVGQPTPKSSSPRPKTARIL